MNDTSSVTGAAGAFDPAGAGWEIVKTSGFGELIGPLWRQSDGRFGFLVETKHLNFADILHGGSLMTLADQAMGMTAQQATGGKMHVTIELNIQFVSTAHLGEFVEARCEVVRLARTLVFMQSKLCVSARIVASATGIWKILAER
jgi:uncharacterized protein (TIGR00369 family)